MAKKYLSREEDSVIIPLLARRSYHLPGNGWHADWLQWIQNNHILFGICLHHHLHPLETWERCMNLTASISFGLVATGTLYYLDMYYAEAMEKELLEVYDYRITQGMVALWTLGGVFHSVFDMVVWNVMACACCHPGGRYGNTAMSRSCKDAGSFALVPIILGLLGLAGYFVLLRASHSEEGADTYENPTYTDDDGAQYYDDDGIQYQNQQLEDVDLDNIRGAENFAFLIKYGIELTLAWFVYFPVLGTIFFSGVLGCNGRLPIVGGRPRDVRLAEEAARDAYQKM